MKGLGKIVAGKITENIIKPSVVFKSGLWKNQAVASLRGPDYFNVIEMITCASPYLKRFWWHKGAGGLTVDLGLFGYCTLFQQHH